MATSPTKLAAALACLLAAATGCAAEAEDTTPDDETASTSAELRIRTGLGVDGDACTVRTKPDGTTVPGTEKDGSCCNDADPNDCVVILKNPFPKAYSFAR